MTRRLKKWFAISDIPGSQDPNLKYGVYHRTIPGSNPPEIDPSAEGVDGKTYIVTLLGDKANSLMAPCPDFCRDEEAARGKPKYTPRILDDLTKLIGNNTALLQRIKELNQRKRKAQIKK